MAVQMRYGDYIKEGFEVVKANLVPSIVFSVICYIPLLNLLAPIFIVNFMAAVKAAKHEGKPIEIGAMFNFENAVDKWVGLVIVGVIVTIGNICLVIPGIIAAGIFMFTAPVLADKSGTPFMNAIKANFKFGKANIVPLVLMNIVAGLVIFIGALACGVGVLVTLPTALAGVYLAYEDHRSALEAAAAEGGVQL